MSQQLAQNTPWLEATAEKVLGRKVTVSGDQGRASTPPPASDRAPRAELDPTGTAAPTTEAAETPSPAPAPASGSNGTRDALRAQAMGDTVVKAMLDVFTAEIDDVQKL